MFIDLLLLVIALSPLCVSTSDAISGRSMQCDR